VSALNFVLGEEPVSEKLSEKQPKEVGQLEDRFIGFFDFRRRVFPFSSFTTKSLPL
jgi:hypothetical protein